MDTKERLFQEVKSNLELLKMIEQTEERGVDYREARETYLLSLNKVQIYGWLSDLIRWLH